MLYMKKKNFVTVKTKYLNHGYILVIRKTVGKWYVYTSDVQLLSVSLWAAYQLRKVPTGIYHSFFFCPPKG